MVLHLKQTTAQAWELVNPNCQPHYPILTQRGGEEPEMSPF
jgi:hypothetical protein